MIYDGEWARYRGIPAGSGEEMLAVARSEAPKLPLNLGGKAPPPRAAASRWHESRRRRGRAASNADHDSAGREHALAIVVQLRRWDP